MTITTYKEDILPEIKYEVELAQLAQLGQSPMEMAMDMEVHEAEAAAAVDVAGCLSLIGPIQLCYDVNVSVPKAFVALKVFGATVLSGEISPAKPCISFKGSAGVAKFDLAVCLKLAQKKITLSGKACVVFGGCKSFNITIFSW
ncbi:hypothetical protein [Microseira sp. BLCC-F43]|jgi:hypothetical protein|uniref:hypothetical protein n=1 Tax=Microseira sp. BLCC-F43 TaxID=3153602 RepID=UPI0035BA7EA3